MADTFHQDFAEFLPDHLRQETDKLLEEIAAYVVGTRPLDWGAGIRLRARISMLLLCTLAHGEAVGANGSLRLSIEKLEALISKAV